MTLVLIIPASLSLAFTFSPGDFAPPPPLSLSLFSIYIYICVSLFASPISYLPKVQCIPFHESLYFIFVTISTVGYGDVNPETVLGQFLVVAFIILAGTLVPRQISKLARYAYT